MIEVFDDVDEALDFLDQLAYESAMNDSYFKAELFKTIDGRWRVGINLNGQMEFDI